MAMSNALPPGYAVPNTSLPKTTGVLNIIFATLMLLFVALQVVMTFLAPKLIDFAQSSVREVQARAEASRKQRIDGLRADEAAAESEAEKERIRGEIRAIEARPVSTGPDMKALMVRMDTPIIRAYSWTDMGTALILNALMLASGVGLLRLKERARRLALWVGGLKLARLLVLLLIQMVFILPISMKMQQDMIAQMGESGAPHASAVQMTAKMGAAAGMAMIVVTTAFAMVWPILMIVLLTRPGSRAACLAASNRPTAEVGGP